MCYCMKVSRNAYYTWLRGQDDCSRSKPTEYLKQRIKILFEQSHQIYGSPKIKKMLEREGLFYHLSYIGRLMKQLGLKSVLRRKYVITTDSSHSLPRAANVLNRENHCDELGKKWVSDITYVRVNSSWNYLTTIIDLADRKIVGWSLSEDMTTTNTVKAAWIKARKARIIGPDFIFHSDQGVQYAAEEMAHLFSSNQYITQSMSRKGNCWDNAVAESFFKSIKHEWLWREKFTSHQQLYQAIETYIKWYNTQRIHESLDNLTPLEMELKLKGIKFKTAD